MRNQFEISWVILFVSFGSIQGQTPDSASNYKQRVLESIEIDILASYYSQDGDNAAVSGGIGTEELTHLMPAVVVSIPLNDDDIITLDVSISEYTSASSSNINPFDGPGQPDPFQASSGASRRDIWTGFTGSYKHSSDDRNDTWSATLSGSSEYDYNSIGFGGSYTKLLNRKNTEIGINTNVYLDNWKAIYPAELEPFGTGGRGRNSKLFRRHIITGNPDYNPSFSSFDTKSRNSFSLGFTASQILSKKLQVSIALDLMQQQGLLSTPFQRVYFGDVGDSFIGNFQLADDIERLPDTRSKVALGGRLHYFINETFVFRQYCRYFVDDWGTKSHTASVILPVKITDTFTLYPSFRFYNQTAADYFAPYEQNLSTDEYYTSDYDLSEFSAVQFGLGIKYTDIFTKLRVWRIGLKSINLQFKQYQRDSGLQAKIISGGFKFVIE